MTALEPRPLDHIWRVLLADEHAQTRFEAPRKIGQKLAPELAADPVSANHACDIKISTGTSWTRIDATGHRSRFGHALYRNPCVRRALVCTERASPACNRASIRALNPPR